MTNNHQQRDHDQSGLKPTPVVVIMVPFLMQSHLNQLLQLSSLISSYNIPVHYVSSTVHNRQVKLRQHASNPNDNNGKIRFHDLPIPAPLSPPPNPLHQIFDTALRLREPVAALIHELSQTADRIVIIHDAMMGSAVQDAASVSNAETYAFNPIAVIGYWDFMNTPIQIETEVPELPPGQGGPPLDVFSFVAYQAKFKELKAGDLHNSCRLLEGASIDLMKQRYESREQWAIGPLNMLTVSDQRKSNREDKCLKWLDKQTPNSVLFVSFGTTTSLTDEQIKELANGLEQSETKFIWVLREADRSDIFTEVKRVQLPEGFEERIEGIGMIVRDWVPQLEILGHPSTGGFMSHCGWNSCQESITMGVPIMAWPMHSDQPRNAVLVTEVLKIGILIDEQPQEKEIITSATVKEAVRKLMALEEGEELRRRAKELGTAVWQSVKEEGAPRKELEYFIAYITR